MTKRAAQRRAGSLRAQVAASRRHFDLFLSYPSLSYPLLCSIPLIDSFVRRPRIQIHSDQFESFRIYSDPFGSIRIDYN